ncbi:MAG: methyltransferase domain-containing protein [Legionellaceae bacterium]|nr:methyltransferase domain-containing protein [Legionellaceae bacterium]
MDDEISNSLAELILLLWGKGYTSLIPHKHRMEFTMLISHGSSTPIPVNDIKQRLKNLTHPILPCNVELQLVDELNEFPLGQFLLANKGLNGFWTAYVILHGPLRHNLHPLEEWLLHYSPGIKATQQRFAIFQETLQSLLHEGIHLASIPCGLMDDLLRLDYSALHNYHLTGIDLDSLSLEQASKNAERLNIKKVTYHQMNAWDLKVKDKFDVITSNGLNIYEQDSLRLIDLYRQFHSSLNKTGYLLTSFITPPSSNWQVKNSDDLIKQAAIFSDILQAGWQCFTTEDETCLQLEEAGFKIEKITYDEQKIFPTVLAKK